MDLVCITRERESSQKADDRHRIFGIEEVCFHLQLDFLDPLSNVARNCINVPWRTVTKK